MKQSGGFPNPVNVIRYGNSAALPEQHVLRAGPLTALLENGTLKYVKFGKTELVRQVYAAVRDDSWGTVVPRFLSFAVDQRKDSFSVAFEAEHVEGDIDFVWNGRIEGSKDGVIRYSMDGAARRSFYRNRIGFCVLHPMEMAGTPVEVETPEGIVHGRFPERISPDQPFMRMLAMKQPVPQGAEVELRFEGDLFEMEDQRNWTDASFKTYCTPLGLPYPVQIQQGEQVKQSVTISLKTEHAAEAQTAVSSSAEAGAPGESVTVQLSEGSAGRLPNLGLIHLADQHALSDWEKDHLAKLHLSHLRVELDVSGSEASVSDWRQGLLQAIAAAGHIGSELELEVVAGNRGEGLSELVAQLKQLSFKPVRMLLYADLTTTEAVLARAQAVMRELDWPVPVGGGTRAYFAELNRASLPLARMEAVSYPLNPQVHAFDNESMVESLSAQAVTVRSTEALVGDIPLAVGPVTLKARFNPHAASRVAGSEPGAVPPRADPRQISLFCAGWTVGSLRNLSAEGVSAITYYETTGFCGLLSREIGLFPVYHIFAEIAEMLGGLKGSDAQQDRVQTDNGPSPEVEQLRVRVEDPLKVEAFALRSGNRLKLLVANLRNEKQYIHLEVPSISEARIRMLDEQTAIIAMTDRDQFRQITSRRITQTVTCIDIELLPYGVGIIDATCH